MRTYRFAAETKVDRRFLEKEESARQRVLDDLSECLGEEGRGPRGGRYLLFGDAEIETGQTGYDFLRDVVSYRMTRMGRYVRPKR